METIKKRPILSILVIGLFIAFVLFNKTTIEEKSEEIKRLRTTITERERENKELSILLKESNSEQDIEIIRNKDGSSIKRIKTKKSSKTSKTDLKETNEKESIKETLKEDIKNEHKIVTNPKKLNIAVGFANDLQPFIQMNYMFQSPFTVGGHIKQNGFGLHIGVSF